MERGQFGVNFQAKELDFCSMDNNKVNDLNPNTSTSIPFHSAGMGSCQIVNLSILGNKNPVVTEKVSGCYEVRIPILVESLSKLGSIEATYRWQPKFQVNSSIIALVDGVDSPNFEAYSFIWKSSIPYRIKVFA